MDVIVAIRHHSKPATQFMCKTQWTQNLLISNTQIYLNQIINISALLVALNHSLFLSTKLENVSTATTQTYMSTML